MTANSEDNTFNRLLEQATNAIEANRERAKDMEPWQREGMLKRIEHLVSALEHAAKPPTETTPTDS